MDPFGRNHPCFLQAEAMDQISDVGEQSPSQEGTQKTINEIFAGFAKELAEQRAKSEEAAKKIADGAQEMAALRAKSESDMAALQAKSETDMAALQAKSETDMAALRTKLQNSEDEAVALNSRIAHLEKQSSPAPQKETFIPGESQLSDHIL